MRRKTGKTRYEQSKREKQKRNACEKQKNVARRLQELKQQADAVAARLAEMEEAEKARKLFEEKERRKKRKCKENGR